MRITNIPPKLTFIACFLLLGNFIFAQDSWNLQRCIQHALENSLMLEQAGHNISFAEINQRQAEQSKLPSFNGNSSLQFNFGRTIDPTSNDFITEQFVSNNFSINSGIVLFNGGLLSNNIKQSRVDLQAAHEDVKQAESDIALSVATAFLNVLLAQEEMENVSFQRELSAKQLDQVDKFINAGSRPKNDRLDFVAQLALAEQNIILAENSLSLAFLNLKQMLRLDPGYEMQIEVPSLDIPADSDPDVASFDQMYSEALRTRPEIRAAEFRLQSAQINQKISEAGFLPSLTFGGSIGTNYSNQGKRSTGEFRTVLEETTIFIDQNPVTVGQEFSIPVFEDDPYFNQLDGNLSYGFGFGLSIPIYNNYNTKASVERAKVNILNTRSGNEQIKENLKTTVQQVIAEARAAKKAFEVANSSLEAQQAAFDNTEKKFNLGAASSFEYINAKNQLETAKINQLVSKYDYLFKLKVMDYYQGKPIRLD